MPGRFISSQSHQKLEESLMGFCESVRGLGQRRFSHLLPTLPYQSQGIWPTSG
jgi:hypothetical protein